MAGGEVADCASGLRVVIAEEPAVGLQGLLLEVQGGHQLAVGIEGQG
jgi:hypothetical protein